MSNKPPSNDALKKSLSRSREVTITVTGRKSGRTISIPVWFVLEEVRPQRREKVLLEIRRRRSHRHAMSTAQR